VERVLALRDTATKWGPIRVRAQQRTRGGEQQIRLTFRPRQFQQEIEDLVIVGDATRETLVKRRLAPRLVLREAPISGAQPRTFVVLLHPA